MSHQWMTDKEGYWKAHAIKGESRQSLSLCLIRPYFGWHPAQPDQPRCKRCEGLLAEKSNTSLTEKSNTSQEIIQVLLDACKLLVEAEEAATDDLNFELLVQATDAARAAIKGLTS